MKSLFSLTACLLVSLLSADSFASPRIIKINITDTIILDIPKNKKGDPTIDFRYASAFSKILGLPNILESPDSLAIRIWYTFSFIDTVQLIKINKSREGWNASLYRFRYQMGNSESSIKLIEKTEIKAEPKSGYVELLSELQKFQFESLVDQRQVKNINLHTDGDGVTIEIKKQNNYRLYGYQMLTRNNTAIREINYIESIVETLSREFDFYPIRPLTKAQKQR